MKNRDAQGAWLRRISDAGGELVLELGGEIDLASISAVQRPLAEALASKPSKVVFELRELRFMDSSGIAMLVATAQQVDRVELRYPSTTVRRVIELAGLSSILPVTS